MQYRKSLYREVEHRTRYYNVSIYLTLFGDYLLTKEYGSVKNKKPTGVVLKYFNDFNEAVKLFEKTIKEKRKKGYSELIYSS